MCACVQHHMTRDCGESRAQAERQLIDAVHCAALFEVMGWQTCFLWRRNCWLCPGVPTVQLAACKIATPWPWHLKSPECSALQGQTGGGHLTAERSGDAGTASRDAHARQCASLNYASLLGSSLLLTISNSLEELSAPSYVTSVGLG